MGRETNDLQSLKTKLEEQLTASKAVVSLPLVSLFRNGCIVLSKFNFKPMTHLVLNFQLKSAYLQIKSLQAENVELKQAPSPVPSSPSPSPQPPAKPVESDRKSRDMKNEIEMLRAEKQKLLDGEAATKQKV